MTTAFIAHDWCGWNENYGRYTHLPSGDTLICRPDMDQRSWDCAQLEWMRKYPGLTVHECPGAYRIDDPLMGTTDEIIAKLQKRFEPGGQHASNDVHTS